MDQKFKKFQPSILQIILSEQKDSQYIQSLQNDLNLLIKQFVPITVWIRWQSLINDLNKFIYYSLTTINGNQTLGEEYFNIIHIDNDSENFRIPSLLKRFALASSYSFGDTIVRKFKNLIINHNFNDNHTNFIDNSKFIFDTLKQINLAIFFMQGYYPNLMKRFLSIRPLSTITNTNGNIGDEQQMKLSFRLLSFLTLIQIILSFYRKYMILNIANIKKNNVCTKSNEIIETSNINNDQQQRLCPLCYSSYENPTLLLCGHIFCWNCIIKCLSIDQHFQPQQQQSSSLLASSIEDDKCPICKMKINNLNQLIFLHNL